MRQRVAQRFDDRRKIGLAFDGDVGRDQLRQIPALVALDHGAVVAERDGRGTFRTGCAAIEIRPPSSTRIESMNPSPRFPNRFSAGISQSSKISSDVSLARRPSLLRPGRVAFGYARVA